ncbi:MAG: hypothetical protein ACLQMU_12240 [Methanoregula sp.]|uniref:hypothetical protein n=3 Tax=Methanoregula sp. TaxID=2052170 RepID=UPI003C38C205
MTSAKCTRVRGFSIIVLVVLIAMVGGSGCIKAVKTTLSGGPPAGETTPLPFVTETPTSDVTPIDIPQSTPTPIPAAVQTPNQSTVITEVTPFVTPNPYVFPQAVQINESPQYPFLYRQPEFTRTYTLIGNGNAFGLQVNVVKAPLYIVFTVNPKYDCLKDPDSCRGTVLVPVNSPYMTITVRDNQTHEIVARDGYGGIYSSDTGNYQFSNYGNLSTSVNGQQTVTSVSEPGPRYIAIYTAGQYQITIEGAYLDVTLSIITGNSPNPLDATEKSASSAPVPTPADDEGFS